MEGFEGPGDSHGTTSWSENPTFVSTGEFTDTCPTDDNADGDGQSLSDSGPPTPMDKSKPEAEHVANERSYFTNTKVIRPYAIEEPDDEPVPPVQRLELPCLPDCLERWQRDLLDRMNDLNDDAAKSHSSKLRASPKRGQKRKPGNLTSSSSYTWPHRFKSNARLEDPALSIPGLSPKRQRRRSKIVGDAARADQSPSLNDFREPRSNGSSSSDLPSTASSAAMSNDSALTDEMDID
ncbi:hypothetical protein N7462_001917 [Penicillium macrosclerotiorum]|uniref:uncharacterized protein n=1 Tax=Penicillium macrosclerotiorum TaxID=303699 RepID=UPI002546D879|nr:uncharacterized protein N7462_001917 [Penicillium macrosclerotiorum]KAJ5692494.1 hypothetical protein N7462_001917 [Penicillium macrosclerotiorum]